ncbi:MAG TPA: UDP-N-acetylmuramoyl-L-alanine--D-glutamate ligase [Candidatus Pacebacteria bacterium]|nr:MAG: UDP-N-acetylmuramoyl-L-alanine-D-glutamate ligase [Microgenomates group bacterium GW2011_GWB1_45_17]KKU24145.1 MAG: UDP-N-acetylmuramoyl-L-alanine-D-glutamate ligase [Microgenomates group bacterium GW2011_GWC1_46_15]KKU24860.1 MAG: UDP-N-acetylmuramoyl-L-alanine-D-glutamate ligase [Microgenomates group bacterium GW2011_GWA1_46_15]HAV14765.1 UDP-N-acetylmuramoyl-L-alanine--D-glutamate ligase [Candidatus Paceibacterota bacterium]
MKIEELHGKRILILGYGREGKATHSFLKKFVPDAVVGTADQSDGPEYLEVQAQYDLAIKTPGIPKRLVTIPYTTATNLFFANLPASAKTIGITGSKGKSTTTTLIYRILQAAGQHVKLAGNIGKPMLTELMEPVLDDMIFVLELSSYQLEDLAYSPNISVFLNVFPEHLDYHGGLEQYFAAKSRIVAHAQSGDSFVYNSAHQRIADLALRTKAHAIPFVKKVSFDWGSSALRGKHNEEDIRAAVTVAQLFDVPMDVIHTTVLAFEPLPHRMQFVGEFGGIKWYDDAIATAPEPTMYAIDTLGDVDTIFLGGTDRGLEFDKLAEKVCGAGIHNVVLFPDTGARIAEALKHHCGRQLNILETKSMEEAVKFAYTHTAKGKSCLLSTASPSYSLWKDFEDKGNTFQKWVRVISSAYDTQT